MKWAAEIWRGEGHYLELDLLFLSLIKPEKKDPSLESTFHMRWGKWGVEKDKKKKKRRETPWKALLDIRTGWLITMSWSERFTHCTYADIIYPLTNADIYVCVYQPEVPVQTKPSDYFRNPSKSLLSKFRAELLILTMVLGCWFWTPNSRSLRAAQTSSPLPTLPILCQL